MNESKKISEVKRILANIQKSETALEEERTELTTSATKHYRKKQAVEKNIADQQNKIRELLKL